MESKKIDVLFGVVIIVFLVVVMVLIKDFNVKRSNDAKEYAAIIANIANQKNNKISILTNKLEMVQKENEDLRNTLAETRNSLEGLTKKLTQPAPVEVPAAVPAPAAAAK